MSKTMIEFRHVKKIFGGRTVIDDLSFTVKEGEIFVLVGTSGSGKTTTLKMINQLFVQTTGDILFNGQRIKDYDLRNLRLEIGYVLQQIALFPTMTVEQNISLIPEMKRVDKEEVKRRVTQLLEDVDLDPERYRKRYPRELSGGEQQRIGILRALAAQPPVVLFDEPFSALDPLVRAQLQDLVLKLHQKFKNTIVFVTHDMDEALKLGDRIGVMKDGKLLQVATPKEIAQHPANEFVENFFSATVGKNLYQTEVEKVVRTGFGVSAPSTTEKLPVIPRTASLDEVFQQLAEHPILQVVDEHGQTTGWVDRPSLFKYLSETVH
ncbi:ATP-binding cassette domain-containing protein [Pediococcus acidilactici]|uniref:ABC transporter ATP-binding protein n=1 Tax=Pediococcus acidilactici TaxID=1254 RepID=UPI0013267C3F|nr:ABC transporter ATP-binding protein [Pediococcus acidilactici]KAF0333868.1 ATP-binding cassette domain-containing protein [Pediococcus acidilactici]KAF0347584.1 ATP-binding cassette domain-containing protein [Pediococcus acidilactici]KAF0393157.1 ATP-binding cassette domain-containing protein [Pediococcus acidilactici]KAF0396488.1 ATP-binding cassette domain-containing protein [Pediococcus acidilactici]KAF0409491.1 ATP-binding cassette domain-containing protein [Pediococcus acidilactici]